MEDNAVIYLRVSTDEQAKDPLNLENQEARCRSYCRQMRLNVVRVFLDKGESARTSNRPEFQRMLAFCKVPRNNVRFVVVQDLSRFARNHMDQAVEMNHLGLSGVRLRSTFESNIDETAAGRLAANIFGAFNQYFSDAHSEKQRVRKRDAVGAGRVPWRAPLGYFNVNSKDGSNIKPDPERAPLILEGFRLIGMEGQSKVTALKIITEMGLTTPKGNPVQSQTFDHILVNPIYAGWVTLRSDPEFKPVLGLHEAIVPQDLFDRVQAILAGKKPNQPTKKTFNPDFPLRHMTHCVHCGKPLTGAFCKGRTDRYPRYWCCNPACEHRVSASKTELESQFQAHLEQLRPIGDLVADLPGLAAKVWAMKQGDSRGKLKRLAKELEDKKQEKLRLVRMRSREELTPAEFDEAKSACLLEISVIEQEILHLNGLMAVSESFVKFAQLQVTNMANFWSIASPDQRQRLQHLLFEGGLEYSRELGFMSVPNSLLFLRA